MPESREDYLCSRCYQLYPDTITIWLTFEPQLAKYRKKKKQNKKTYDCWNNDVKYICHVTWYVSLCLMFEKLVCGQATNKRIICCLCLQQHKQQHPVTVLSGAVLSTSNAYDKICSPKTWRSFLCWRSHIIIHQTEPLDFGMKTFRIPSRAVRRKSRSVVASFPFYQIEKMNIISRETAKQCYKFFPVLHFPSMQQE